MKVMLTQQSLYYLLQVNGGSACRKRNVFFVLIRSFCNLPVVGN